MKMTISVLFLIPFFCFSQLSPKVDSLFKEINASDQVQNEVIGMVGSTYYPEYENLYVKLDSIATEDELLYISSKGNNTIKYHMNDILVDRKSKRLADLFVQYLYDNQKIYVSGGCTGTSSSLAGALYRYIFYQSQKIENIQYNKKHYTKKRTKKLRLFGN